MQTQSDTEVLRMALVGLETEKHRLEERMAAIRRQLSGGKQESWGIRIEAPQVPGRRRLSAAARKRIAAAQRKRWAKFHRERAK